MFFKKTDPKSIHTKIGIWGATSAGKSSYLAALSLASVYQSGTDIHVAPDDRLAPSSSDRWHELRAPFVQLRMPPGTQFTEPIALSVTQHAQTRNVLLYDPRGGDFTDSRGMDHDFWQALAGTDGIVYLYDPIRDFSTTVPVRGGLGAEADLSGAANPAASLWLNPTAPMAATATGQSNYEYLYRGVDQLHQICKEKDRLIDGKLPHYLAVCLTKLDHNEVFAKIDENDLFSPKRGEKGRNEDGSFAVAPILRTDQAKRAFRMFAPELLSKTLVQNFLPERIAYFGVSSCGYYSEERMLRTGNSSNVGANGIDLRKEPRPVSVLQPFTWLVDSAMDA